MVEQPAKLLQIEMTCLCCARDIEPGQGGMCMVKIADLTGHALCQGCFDEIMQSAEAWILFLQAGDAEPFKSIQNTVYAALEVKNDLLGLFKN